MKITNINECLLKLRNGQVYRDKESWNSKSKLSELSREMQFLEGKKSIFFLLI